MLITFGAFNAIIDTIIEKIGTDEDTAISCAEKIMDIVAHDEGVKGEEI